MIDLLENPNLKDPRFDEFKKHIKQEFFTAKYFDIINKLVKNDQTHLFEFWTPIDQDREEKNFFLKTLIDFDSHYSGGLSSYISRVQSLLLSPEKRLQPFRNTGIAAPETYDLSNFGADYISAEQIGLSHLQKSAFVLVAGGLGERLGYPGIKIDIPFEMICQTTYLKYTIDYIKAVETRSSAKAHIPLIIMTSDDTHNHTVETLAQHHYYGLSRDQVTLLKQNPVPAVKDRYGHFAMEKPYRVIFKPGGHGHIHKLMFESGLARQLESQGFKHLIFLQDTNAQAFNALAAFLGVTIQNQIEFNFMAVRRFPKETTGAIAKLNFQSQTKTLNIEYNVLDRLLKESGNSQGDSPGDNQYSPFPGNVNCLIANLHTYNLDLDSHGGEVPEFINPKYEDEAEQTFQTPARLESMMQDLPKLFDRDEKTGVTLFHREWCFSANKNDPTTAKDKFLLGLPPECAVSAENDFYESGRVKCELSGMSVGRSKVEKVLGIPICKGPKIVFSPRFAISLNEVQEKIKSGTIKENATLILNGQNITINDLTLEDQDVLEIHAIDQAFITIDSLNRRNPGYMFQKLDLQELEEKRLPPYILIRGFQFTKGSPKIYHFNESGHFIIQPNGDVIRVS